MPTRLSRSLIPEEEELTAKLDWIQSRIWSELRKHPVLTLALSCSTCCGVSLPGSPLWWIAQRASSPALRKTRSHSPKGGQPAPHHRGVFSLVFPPPTRQDRGKPLVPPPVKGPLAPPF